MTSAEDMLQGVASSTSSNNTIVSSGTCWRESEGRYFSSALGSDMALPDWAIITLCVMITLLSVAITFAYGLVIFVVLNDKKLKSNPSNFNYITLAVADMLVAILILPIHAHYVIHGRWLLPWWTCQIWLAGDMTFCTASILTILAIAYDRYLCIKERDWYRTGNTKKRAAYIITIVWVVSFSVSAPQLLGLTTQPDTFGPDTPCMLPTDQGYVLFTALVSFYIPLGCMICLYSCLHTTLKKQSNEKQMDNATTTASESTRAARSTFSVQEHKTPRQEKRDIRTTRRVVILMVVFVMCWLPFFSMYVIAPFCPTCCPHPIVLHIFSWLGYLNSVLNPIIYTFFNRNFRSAYKRVWHNCICRASRRGRASGAV